MPDTEILQPPVQLGPLIDQLQALSVLKTAAEAKVNDIKTLIAAKELQIQSTMEAQGILRAAGNTASVSIVEAVVPQVEDWDAFWAFIRKNNAFELLEKRPAVGAWRERAASRRDKTVPGTVPYTKRTLTRRGN